MKKTGSPSPLLAALALSAFAFASCETTGTTSRGDASSQGTLVATTRFSSGSGTTPSVETAGQPDGIVRINGNTYFLKGRGLTKTSGRQRFTSGIYLEPNGDVTTQDGRRVKLREGDMVTMAGEIREAPPGLQAPR